MAQVLLKNDTINNNNNNKNHVTITRKQTENQAEYEIVIILFQSLHHPAEPGNLKNVSLTNPM